MSDLVQRKLTQSRRRQLEVLEYLYDNRSASSSFEVAFGPLVDQIGNDAIQASVPTLVERGYVKADADLTGYGGAYLQPSGANVVEEVRAHRDSVAERNMAVRDAILYWLYEQGAGAHPTLDTFLTSEHATFYGETFTKDEVHHGSRWLRDEGYIEGDGAWGGGIPRPGIGTKGTRIVESGRSVNDPQDQASSQTFNSTFHGPAGSVAMGSSNFTQNSTMVNEAAGGLAAVVGAVREVFELLADAGVDRDDLEDVLDEADAVAASPAEPDVVRSALTKMQTVVATGTGSAVGTVIVDRITSLLNLLP